MPFVATEPHFYVGQVVDNGHCVRYCQTVADVPHTSRWEPGKRVRDAIDLPEGTIIATFDPDTGEYENDTASGRSHAAVLLRVDEDGLHVLDQWQGHPVTPRKIRFKGGTEPHVDDGDTYYVVEAANGRG